MEKRKGPPDVGADSNPDSRNDGDDGEEGLELLDVTGTSGQNQLTSPPRTTTAANVYLLQSRNASTMGNPRTGFTGSGGERVIVIDPENLNLMSILNQGSGFSGSVHSQQILVENLSPLVSLSSRGSSAGGSSQMPPYMHHGMHGNFPAHPGAYGPACAPNGQYGMPVQHYHAPGPSVPYGPGPYGPTSLPDHASQHPYDFQGHQQYFHSQGYYDNIQGAPLRGMPPQDNNYGGRPGPGFTADPNANAAYTARYGSPYAANHHQQGFWQYPHGAPPQDRPHFHQQGGPMPPGLVGSPPGYQQPKTIRIDTQVEPKFLRLYFANENNGGGKIDGEPVDHRSSGGYVLITFLNAEVAARLLSLPHCVKGENLRVSLHHKTHSESNRTVVVSGPLELIADKEYLELYFTNREESSGGPVDGVEYDPKDQVTRIVFKDASVAKAVLDQEQHTLDDQKLVVGTSVPQKSKAPAPQPKKTPERRAPALSQKKIQPGRTAPQQGYSSVTQPKQKAPSVSTKQSPTTRTCDKRNTVVHEMKKTQAPSNGPKVVCVRGLDLCATSHETLFLYFENKRRSGVEQVTCMVRDFRDNVVYISFPTEEDALKVFEGSHTLDDKKLDVSLGKMPDLMTKTLAARDLPQGIDLTSLQQFIQMKTGQTVVSIDDMDGVVILKFQRNIDLATTQSTLRNELFDGHTIVGDPLMVTNKVMVCGLPKTPPVTKQAVEDVFSPFARVVQTELASSSGKAVITFQDAQAAERVVGKTLSFSKHALETYLFFDRIGMEFQSTVEPVPSQPDMHEQLQHQLSLQAVQREVTQQPQQANHIQEVQVRSGATLNSASHVGLNVQSEARQVRNASDSPLPSQLSETFRATNSSIRTEITAQVNVKETIRGVSPAKQRYCQDKNIGQELVDHGLIVHYNTDDDCIELDGKGKDVAEMRELVEMPRDFLKTVPHTWDARLPLEILRSEAVEKAIREACRKQDFDGAIAFTANGFEVAVWDDLQRAQRVRDMAAGLLITKAINTSGTDDGDPNQKARWKQLVSSLQRQNDNKVILRENPPSQLLVMGIRETVDDTVRKLEEFLAEHSVAERTFQLPQGDTETLFWEFFGQAQTRLIKDNNIEVKDGRVVVKGNTDVIQTAEKLMRDFERNLVTIRKKINEPSIQRLMQTPEWNRNCQNIESQHKCKISPENGQSGRTLFGAAPSSPVSDSDVCPSFTYPMARLFQHGVNSQRATGGSVAYKPRIHLHKRADITKDEHQLLVNSTQQNLELNLGKVSRALLIAGGQRIQDECRAKYPRGINIGDVAITGGGKLYCKKLAHCCLPFTPDKEQMRKAVKTNVTKCLEEADKYGLDSVAFPAIGTGTLQYPPDIVAKAMYEATLAYGRQNPGTTIDDVSFVLLTEDVHNHAPFQAEHTSYQKQLSDSASGQDDEDQNMFQTLINPNAQGVRSFDYFSRTKETATFRITAHSNASANAAAAELQKCYHDNVKQIQPDTQHLEQWDDLQLKTLLNVCKQVHVDVRLNCNLNRIELRGFLSDLDRIYIHDIIKQAEEGVHEKQNALLMSKQVQWSRIEVDMTGEFLAPYDPVINYRIEMAYIHQNPNLMMGVTYVDFAKWKELPETPGDLNHPPVSVHRHSITEVMAFKNPQHWTDMGTNELDLVRLQENNPEYERVESAFRESVKHPSTKIVRIERVQSTTLHKQYMALKAEMGKRVKDCERPTLWHGTKEENVDGIVRFGFNRSYSRGKKRSAHGQGVYFATEASYSCHNQYSKKDGQGQRRLFLCKVLVGKFVKGHKDMRVADHNVYDSAVDDVSNPGIFVIFKDVQAYPEYLIICKDK